MTEMQDQERERAHAALEQIQASIAAVDGELKKLNGTVARHNEELYGVAERRKIGLIERSDETHDMITSTKAVLQTIKYIVAAFGATNLLVWAVTIYQGANT